MQTTNKQHDSAAKAPRGRGGRRRGATAWLLAAALAAAGTSALSAERGEKLDAARAALEEWVKVRKLISQERRDWSQAKDLLDRRIEVVKAEVDSVQAEIARVQAGIAERDKQRDELNAENDNLKEATASLADVVVALEDRTRQLVKRLPEHVKDRIKPLTQRLPEGAADVRLTLSLRFQNVVGILNEINKANREIVVQSEVRVLPDGTSAQVTSLYIGLGQAYYVGGNGTIAGIGAPAAEGWQWTPANAIAAPVAEAVAMLKNEKVAAFVKLPLKIQ
jgi:septal ring factor EnvC (AmiA/AmiB activator)